MILQSRIYFIPLIIFASLLNTFSNFTFTVMGYGTAMLPDLNRLGKIVTCYAVCTVFQTIFGMPYCISALYLL